VALEIPSLLTAASYSYSLIKISFGIVFTQFELLALGIECNYDVAYFIVATILTRYRDATKKNGILILSDEATK
jgi:hypothetical protein